MTTAKLRKENQQLKLDIAELQKKLEKVTDEISQRSDMTDQNGLHARKPPLSPGKEKSVEYISDQYDELVSFKNNTLKVLKDMKSQLGNIELKCDKISEAVDQMEEYSYQFNIKIVGMPQHNVLESAEVTSKLCLDLFKAIGVEDVSLQDIDIAHRIPARRQTDRPSAIVCKFVRRLAKQKVMAARLRVRNVQASQFGFSHDMDVGHLNIYDHLTPRLQQLLFEAKKFQVTNQFKFCWVKKNMVCLRKFEGDSVIRVNNLQDLLSLQRTV